MEGGAIVVVAGVNVDALDALGEVVVVAGVNDGRGFDGVGASVVDEHADFVHVSFGSGSDEVGGVVGAAGGGAARTQVVDDLGVAVAVSVVEGTAAPSVGAVDGGAPFDQKDANGQVALGGRH
eukprot:scaffold421193_cov99-Attheya_sp.AAC.1